MMKTDEAAAVVREISQMPFCRIIDNYRQVERLLDAATVLLKGFDMVFECLQQIVNVTQDAEEDRISPDRYLLDVALAIEMLYVRKHSPEMSGEEKQNGICPSDQG